MTEPAPIPVTGVVQHYAWGDPTFIPELLGIEPDGTPWAELWLGTHPNGPTVTTDGTPLAALVGELPYLVKVLAAAEPLSLQVHPNAEQAVEGFARGAYPDDAAKPELLCALTPFDALCGIRPVDATLELLERIGATDLHAALAADGVAATIAGLYRRTIAIGSTIAACRAASDGGPSVGDGGPGGAIEAALVAELADRYPDDPSVVVTLLLNRVQLEPGEALHLTAGNLHAYLYGAGVELMAASDNVVRGGLTVKHVNVDEVLRILDPTPLPDPVMTVAEPGVYPLPEAGCSLVRLAPGTAHRSAGHELAVTLDGATFYLPPDATFTAPATTFVVTTIP